MRQTLLGGHMHLASGVVKMNVIFKEIFISWSYEKNKKIVSLQE